MERRGAFNSSMEIRHLIVFPLLLIALFPIVSSDSSSSSSSSPEEFKIDGTVLELTESNFDSAIQSLDYVLVDFYAPWCGHCKKLSPELDAAAPTLAGLPKPIAIAKLDADKYRRLAEKHDVDGFPTLKLFVHGAATDYYGPRKAEVIVRFMKKYVAPDLPILESDTALNAFVEDAGKHFPLFIGFGLDKHLIKGFSAKYKKQAWFAIASNFSEEDTMVKYNFDKVPALVSVHPKFHELGVFYGPFEDSFLEDYIKQSLLPLCVPIRYETLKMLKEDKRKIVLTFVRDELEEESLNLLKMLRAAASANRNLVFAYVGWAQWAEFIHTFEIGPKDMPQMIVWDGNSEYISVIGSEILTTEDQGSQISRFLEGYSEGRVIKKEIGPSLKGLLKSFIGVRALYAVVFVFLLILMIWHMTKGLVEDSRIPDGAVRLTSGSSTNQVREKPIDYQPQDKLD